MEPVVEVSVGPGMGGSPVGTMGSLLVKLNVRRGWGPGAEAWLAPGMVAAGSSSLVPNDGRRARSAAAIAKSASSR